MDPDCQSVIFLLTFKKSWVAHSSSSGSEFVDEQGDARAAPSSEPVVCDEWTLEAGDNFGHTSVVYAADLSFTDTARRTRVCEEDGSRRTGGSYDVSNGSEGSDEIDRDYVDKERLIERAACVPRPRDFVLTRYVCGKWRAPCSPHNNPVFASSLFGTPSVLLGDQRDSIATWIGRYPLAQLHATLVRRFWIPEATHRLYLDHYTAQALSRLPPDPLAAGRPRRRVRRLRRPGAGECARPRGAVRSGDGRAREATGREVLIAAHEARLLHGGRRVLCI